MGNTQKKKEKFGQYFTSGEIAEFMVGLIEKGKKSEILEPGAGEGVFIRTLLNHGFQNIHAYEIDKDCIANYPPEIHSKEIVQNKDFLKTSPERRYDVIIGNPPYVHWNDIHPPTHRILKGKPYWKSLVNGEWDLLYAFIVWSIEKLKPNGELIFIVPYYWFYSTFGYSLREFVAKHGEFEIIVHFGEFKLFPDCAPNNIIFRYRRYKSSTAPGTSIKVAEYKRRKGKVDQVLERIRNFLSKDKTRDYIFEDENYKFFYQHQFPNNLIWSLQTDEESALIRGIESSTLTNVPIIPKSSFFNSSLINSEEKQDNERTTPDYKKLSQFMNPKSTEPSRINELGENHQDTAQPLKVTHLLDKKDIKKLHLEKENLTKFNGLYYSSKKSTQYLKLKQVLKVGVGMVSGFDKGFRVEKEFIENLSPKEKDLITYFVKGKNCKRYWVDGGTPYIFADKVPSEEILKEDYPNIYSYFKPNRDRLEKRYKPKRVKYYQWATVRNYKLFTDNFKKEKLFVPCLDRHKNTRFSYTTQPLFGSGDVLVITRNEHVGIKESLKYICAWLNSKKITKWYDLKGSKRGHRRAFTQTRVEEVPIRLIDWNEPKEVKIYNEIIKNVDEILQKKQISENLEPNLNSLIGSLF